MRERTHTEREGKTLSGLEGAKFKAHSQITKQQKKIELKNMYTGIKKKKCLKNAPSETMTAIECLYTASGGVCTIFAIIFNGGRLLYLCDGGAERYRENNRDHPSGLCTNLCRKWTYSCTGGGDAIRVCILLYINCVCVCVIIL